MDEESTVRTNVAITMLGEDGSDSKNNSSFSFHMKTFVFVKSKNACLFKYQLMKLIFLLTLNKTFLTIITDVVKGVIIVTSCIM